MTDNNVKHDEDFHIFEKLADKDSLIYQRYCESGEKADFNYALLAKDYHEHMVGIESVLVEGFSDAASIKYSSEDIVEEDNLRASMVNLFEGALNEYVSKICLQLFQKEIVSMAQSGHVFFTKDGVLLAGGESGNMIENITIGYGALRQEEDDPDCVTHQIENLDALRSKLELHRDRLANLKNN